MFFSGLLDDSKGFSLVILGLALPKPGDFWSRSSGHLLPGGSGMSGKKVSGIVCQEHQKDKKILNRFVWVLPSHLTSIYVEKQSATRHLDHH